MRRTTKTLTVASVLLLAGAAMAQSAEPAPPPAPAGEERLFGPGVDDAAGPRARRGGFRERERGERGFRRGHRLPPEVHEEIVARFDIDGDGHLSREERQAGGEELRAAVKAAMEDLKAALVAEFDADGDGELSEDERLAAREAKRAELEAKRAALLAEYDADGSGRLERGELEQAVADGAIPRMPRGRRGHRGPALDGEGPHGPRGLFGDGPRRDGRGPHGPLPPELLERFDLDADGALSQDERHAARDEMRQRFESRRADVVEEFDADGDGELTGAERDAARAAMRQRVHMRLAVHAADLNGDGALDAEELAEAGVRIVEGDPAMDANGDGAVNDDDFQALVDRVGAER